MLPVYKVICSGCGRHFEWMPRESANEVPPSYHSKNCRKRPSDSKPGLCPRPYKRVFVTYELAQQACTELDDPMLKPYRCTCGALHIGHPTAWVVRWRDRRERDYLESLIAEEAS